MKSLFEKQPKAEPEQRFADFDFCGYRLNTNNRRNPRLHLETSDGKSIEVMQKSRAMSTLMSSDLHNLSSHRVGVELRRYPGEQWKIFALGNPRNGSVEYNFSFMP